MKQSEILNSNSCLDFRASNTQYCQFHNSDSDGIGFCKKPNYFRCEGKMVEENIKQKIELKKYISQSQKKDFHLCKRLYYLKHIEGYSLKQEHLSNAVKIGQLWDKVEQVVFGQATMDDVGDIIEIFEIDWFDVVKVKALWKVKEKLIDPDTRCVCQKTIEATVDIPDLNSIDGTLRQLNIKGILDRAYPNYFVESKLTTRPTFYSEPYPATVQIGTYFMLDKTLSHCIMELTRPPELRPKDYENSEEYGERCYKDIISKPSRYFIGYNRENNSFGITLYRSEFDLDELEFSYAMILHQLNDMKQIGFESFYKEHSTCNNVYGRKCEFLPICEADNTISPELFLKHGEVILT